MFLSQLVTRRSLDEGVNANDRIIAFAIEVYETQAV